MTEWLVRHRRKLHGILIALGSIWLLAALIEGRPLGAAVGACVAFSQAMLLLDARRPRQEPPAPAGRLVGFAMLAAGVACIGSVAVILLAA